MKVTDEMIEAYGQAWAATPKCEPGDRRRAGIQAVLDLIEELEKHPRYRVLTGVHEGREGRRMKIEQKAHPYGRTWAVTLEFPEGDTVCLWDWAVKKL